ncbi:Telomerase protein component 1 [Schistosoma japonicum]|nr:Telomerase protein component 1 [Schistosoma japonicum]KAH8877570.1 Telomerase protein component 1 [Schistosoma japonicum]
MNIPKTLDWCAGTGSGKLYESSLEFQPDTNYSDLAISTPDTEDYCSLKYDLVDLLSALLISKHDDENGKLLGALVVKCIEKDPEFMLKVALYFRRLLDIGKISNLLISGSCFYAHCQVFINKYFDVCICSPSDWIEIAECYSLLSGDYELKEMPKALRKCMVSKFLEFDQYQLAQCKQKLGAGGSFKPKICSRSSGGTMMSVLADTFLSRVSDSSPTLFTLKDLIRKLHISKPAFNVMCALGKVYPKDTTAFAKMGLEGDWDASKAGLRMKLPVHSKWKVRSAADKSPHSWTKAIMSGALSHELILQNLKSIICSSISQNGHGIVLQRLSNPELVIEGKQLPVAYITAYMTVEKLHDILSKNTYSKRFKDARLQESEKIRCKYLFKSKKPRVSLSVRHNLPPIRCSLLVICSFCSGFDLQKPRRSSRVKNLVNLLSFICGAICSALCENSVIFVVLNNKYDIVSIDRMLLLLYGSLYHTEENKKHSSLFISPNVPLIDKIKLIYKNRKYLESYPLSSTLDKFIAFRKKFDKIVVFGDCPDSIAKYVLNHRVNIGPIKAIWSNLSGRLVDSVFKYLSLPDDKCLVEQIDKIDETYKLNALCNFCRVYISSSYADMHSERDLICQKLAPNLFQNVAIASNNNICLDLVDLRFGVSDAAARSLKALEMYLKQAAASDIFVLLLGDTYGWIPEEALVKALPDSLLTEVNRFYKPGMSIMEMEYHMAKLGAVNNVSESSTDMFRSRLFVKIPNEHKHTFRDQDPASVRHLNVFKQLLLNDGVFIHNYSVQFAGVIDNYPVLENLDNFASRFLSTLESSVMKLYHTPVTESTKLPMDSSSSELMNISTFFANYVNPIGNEIGPRHLIYLQHTFKSMIGQRNSNLPVSEHTKCDESSSDTHQKMKTEITSSKYQKNNGGILIITGNPGSGKTVHLAALAMSLDKGTQQSTVISSPAISTTTTNNTQKSILSTSNSLAQYQILIHFTNGIPSTGLPSCKQLSKMLDHWIKSLIVHLQSFSNSSNILKMFLSKIKVHFASANTANDFHNLKLKMLCLNKMITFLGCIPELHYAFLIDDVDYLDPLLLHDWLPSVIPKNIQFIFTCHSKSEIIHKLTYQYSTCSVYQIPQLTPEESRAVILTHLHCNGVPFVNSQLECEIAALISASELNNPLYFSMACKCLQLCRTVDEVKSHLKTLPSTSHLLIEQIVKNLQSEYKSVTVATLGFLIFCRHSLSIKELLILLNEWLFITSSSTTTITTAPCSLDEKLNITWENQPWKMLSTIKDKPNDFESICALESNIEKFILSKLSNNNLCGVYTKSKQQFCLSPLKFHIVLNELQPLLAIFNRSLNCLNAVITNNLTLLSDEMVTLKHKISLWSLGAGKLSFLSHSIKELVFDIFFKNQESYMYSTYTFQTTIHKILAIALSDLDDKLYHFLYADELDIICHLLTSPTFICKILSNHPSTLIKFLNGYPTNNPGIQGKWKRKMKSCTFGDKIDAMKKFILMNYEFLVKYPNSFCELAINQDSSEWIHTLGLCLLYLSNSHLQLSQPNLNYSPILFRLNSSKRMLISPVQQNISYKPIVTSLGSMDVPTSVEVYSTVNLLVYGTKCGTIAFVEMSSMHELGSLSAHHASVQSLCFLDDFSAKSENIKVPLIPVSQLWLMSASEDGDVFIWDVSRFLRIIESNTLYEGATTSQLASLCGYHRRCDCMVYLWDISELGTNCTQLSSLSSLTNVDSVKLHPFKSIDVSTYPVVSVAFRLPYLSEEEQDELMHDILAIGCWDGTIYFYNLSSLSVVRSLSASSSLCSLAYSPNGGKLLATLDRNGQLMLWNDDILWYEGGLIQEYSCFVTDYFPCNQADVLIPNQYGRICFSKPNGQYIFQSGGGQYLNNYINIWDVNLWAVYSPWISVKQPSEISSGGPIYITYTTVLSTYQHVFIGWSNGDLTVVHIYDGQLLHHMKAPTDDNSSIQCISSSAGRSYSQFDAHHITFGYSSGAVRIYLCIFKPKISSYKDRYVYQAEYATSELHFQLIDTLWSHSINHDVNGIGENGGTLCTDSYFCVAITGGGNAEVWVNFIGRRTGSKIKKSICLKEHNSEVIAISAESKFFATASKSRQIALYKYDSRERTITLWHLINDVTTAAISSFSLLRVFIGTKTISISVYIGDSNSKLYNYSITKDGFELRQTLSANTFPIKFMWHTWNVRSLIQLKH